MDTRPTPITISLSMLALAFIAFMGMIYVNTGLWAFVTTGNPSLPAVLGRTLIYVLLPVLAMLDIMRNKLSGRYLALLCFVATSAVLFRGFLDGAMLPVRGHSADGFMSMFCFAASVAVLALIVGLGFTHNADHYFETDEEPIELPISHAAQIESVVPDAELHPEEKTQRRVAVFRDIMLA